MDVFALLWCFGFDEGGHVLIYCDGFAFVAPGRQILVEAEKDQQPDFLLSAPAFLSKHRLMRIPGILFGLLNFPL